MTSRRPSTSWASCIEAAASTDRPPPNPAESRDRHPQDPCAVGRCPRRLRRSPGRLRGGPQGVLSSSGGPAPAFRCRFDSQIDAFAGAYATASAIGWQGNDQGVVTCLGGSFYLQSGIDRGYGFGIYDGAQTTWTDLDGYLPAQTTKFHRYGATISITDFADKVVIGGHPFVAVYSRVAVDNSTSHDIKADPDPSPGMVILHAGPDTVRAHSTSDHDYVVAADRFGNQYSWPDAGALAGAGGFVQHLGHMRRFWDGQLAEIAAIDVPDASLVDAYKSGFVYTQIARSGERLDTGVNGYESEFNHDVIGILANLFTQGDFSDALALLVEARNVVGAEGGEYADGTWTYPWPWAIYLLKTGDLDFVRRNFEAEGPAGSSQPSIQDAAHQIARDRTGPGGIMKATDDVDANGYWAVDDFEALMGLAAYRYLASRLADGAEVQWATQEYDSLLAATDSTLDATIAHNGLDYLPCSMVEPNSSNRCNNPLDANWAATFEFGKWAWDGQLFGATVQGPGLDLIDQTYQYGFGRLQGALPSGTFGGYPSDFFSTAYNGGYGSWALAGTSRRDQGISSYQFMIDADQSGPYSWWESSSAPDPSSPWTGSHPGGGQGSSPHAWGMAEANKVLLDSLAAQRSDGSLIVGRGIPGLWLGDGDVVSVDNFPTVDGSRLGFEITSSGQQVTLAFRSGHEPGPVLFELPAFVNDIASSSSGTVDESTGTVTLPASTTQVTVEFRQPPAS